MMNQRTKTILEYEKITHMLAEQAFAAETKEKIRHLSPYTDSYKIEEELEETEEAVRLLTIKGSLPIGSFYEIDSIGARAQKGGRLSISQIRKVGYNIKTAVAVAGFLNEPASGLETIYELVNLLQTFPDLVKRIDRAFLTDEDIADAASPALRRIRAAKLKAESDIRDKLNKMLTGNKDLLQDEIITVRADRYVLPVKQQYRNQFPGIVHDKSSTGATLFIEPQVVVELNNRMKELESEEIAETDRILFDFSNEIANLAEVLSNNQRILIHLDYMMAKARLAVLMNAERPRISDSGQLLLKGARHPLISRDVVVPIDVSLVQGGILVITGPNTGGKTVTLKTVGLMAMMFQSGLFIPASQSGEMPVFDNIFADIGDEQSVEQSLSTFSSHMTNIVRIIKNIRKNSLTLLDELGAGTDPAEGAALAIAILEELKEKNVQVLATTHYTELKKYAVQTEGVQNASMEFDIETLSPTYRLIMGTPGKSNAFEISKKLGLDENIVRKAADLLNEGDIAFESILEAIEHNKKQAEKERDEALELNLLMKQEHARADKEIEQMRKRVSNEIAEAKEKARHIIEEAERVSEELVKEMRELDKGSNFGRRANKLGKIRKKLREADKTLGEDSSAKIDYRPANKEEIKRGVRVKVMTIGQNGVVIDDVDSRGNVSVQVGSMKLKAMLKDLQIIDDGRSGKKKLITASKRSGLSKTRTISSSIDIRGKNAEEAVADVLKYIDDAVISNLARITIIHGRGEGILQEAIRKELKSHSQIESFRYGNYNEGGEGVTIADLKK